MPRLSDEGGINIEFLKSFREFIVKEISNGKRFILIVGGGKTTRMYNKCAAQIVPVSNEDLDWIGIHATRLNAHLLRTVFAREAYPVVIDHDPSLQETAVLRRKKANLLLASGWKPGWSTDYVAVRLAQKFQAKTMLDVGDVPFVYDKDPKKHQDAKPIHEISWAEYRKLIPAEWSPGMATPLDPIASRLAQKTKLVVKMFKGTDLGNFKNAVAGKEFEGTIIK